MSALSHEPLRVSSEPPEQFTTAVPHAAESVAREPPERVNAAVVAVTASGEYISLPPDAVKSWYNAGEVVMVTSRSLNRRASTVKTILSPAVSALMCCCMLKCVRITAVPTGMSSLRISFMPSVISMPSAAAGISMLQSTISPSGVM